jgi:Fe-S-cluster-containing dehydrogenase component/formate-dependent nitrite reductase membrane component NrfD
MKYGFVIDQRKCIGCHACTVACKAEHDIPIGVYRTWVKYIEKGEFPNTRRHFLVNRCNHCDDAPCVAICPTRALFKRADGIVDFDRDRCIGCKSCMQACPYDALYIDPNTHTAAKCNFCAHRVELGLQPACVVVCPEQAIVAGDLHDPNSQIARLVGRESVRVRRPEQGTGPNVYYIGADESAIDPEALDPRADLYMFMRPARLTGSGLVEYPRPASRLAPVPVARPAPAPAPMADTAGGGGSADTFGAASASARTGDLHAVSAEEARAMELRARGVVDRRTYRGSARVEYDIPKARPWGWMVSAYLGTKSIAAGVVLTAWLRLGLGLGSAGRTLFGLAAPALALAFLGLTLLFLVADLKRPERFWFILLKPNWRSWLVWGAWILMVYGALLVAWVGSFLLADRAVPGALVWLTAILAAGAAGYTAFLFGQAEGRDLWQSPLLLPHLLVQALLAGTSTLALVGLAFATDPPALALLARVLLGAVVAHAFLIGSELFVPHTNRHVAAASHIIVAGPLRLAFWALAVGVGIVLPAVFVAATLATSASVWLAPGAVSALVGLFAYEHCFVVAGQSVPLS